MQDEPSTRTAPQIMPPRRNVECENEPNMPPARSTAEGSGFPLTHSKQSTKLFLIYGKPGVRTLPFLAISSLFCSLSPAPAIQTSPKFNRQLSQGPCLPFSLFTFPFSLRPFTRLVDLISHSPLVTNHCISNRIPEILEPHLTPALSIKHPVLIANFEPTVCVSPRLPEPSRGAQPETSVARQFTCQRDCCRV
jgi:hypothetical protein